MLTFKLYFIFSLFYYTVTSVNILSIGNSLTHRNCFPCKIRRFYNSNHTDRLQSFRSTTNAVQLSYHTYNRRTKRLIKSRGYKAIILQEQSDVISKVPYNPRTFIYFNNRFSNRIRKFYILQIWAHRTGYFVREQHNIIRNTESISYRTGMQIIPLGHYWLYIYLFVPELWMQLYRDDRHLSVMGSYLTACIVYRNIFNIDEVLDTYRPRGIVRYKRKKLLRICNK